MALARMTYLLSFTLDGKPQKVRIETAGNAQIHESLTITAHPLLDGTMVADHSYKEPTGISLAGTFSLNGSQSLNFAGGTLDGVRQYFSRLKEEAILINIAKIATDTGAKRFSSFPNLVLADIQWSEGVNTLGFSFSFTQVLLSDATPAEVSTDINYLPNVTDPKQLSFTDAILDWDMVDRLVVQSGIDAGIIEQEFIDALATFNVSVTTAAVGAAIGIAGASVKLALAKGAAISAATPIPGARVAAIAALVVVFGIGIYNAFKSWQKHRRHRGKVFKAYKDDKKMRAESERFGDFIGEIHKLITVYNEAIKVYQVSSDEEQTTALLVGGDYYVFKFTRAYTEYTTGKEYNNGYRCIVTDVDGKVVGKLLNVITAPTNYMDCTAQNALFRAAETGEYVHIVRATEDANPNATDAGNLTNYYVITSTINPEELTAKLTQTINDAFTS